MAGDVAKCSTACCCPSGGAAGRAHRAGRRTDHHGATPHRGADCGGQGRSATPLSTPSVFYTDLVTLRIVIAVLFPYIGYDSGSSNDIILRRVKNEPAQARRSLAQGLIFITAQCIIVHSGLSANSSQARRDSLVTREHSGFATAKGGCLTSSGPAGACRATLR